RVRKDGVDAAVPEPVERLKGVNADGSIVAVNRREGDPGIGAAKDDDSRTDSGEGELLLPRGADEEGDGILAPFQKGGKERHPVARMAVGLLKILHLVSAGL